MEPFARIPLLSDDYENSAQRDAVDEAVGRRRRSTRKANLGTFTGYRIGLDVGNGNIGWHDAARQSPARSTCRLGLLYVSTPMVNAGRGGPRT